MITFFDWHIYYCTCNARDHLNCYNQSVDKSKASTSKMKQELVLSIFLLISMILLDQKGVSATGKSFSLY